MGSPAAVASIIYGTYCTNRVCAMRIYSFICHSFRSVFRPSFKPTYLLLSVIGPTPIARPRAHIIVILYCRKHISFRLHLSFGSCPVTPLDVGRRLGRSKSILESVSHNKGPKLVMPSASGLNGIMSCYLSCQFGIAISKLLFPSQRIRDEKV
jgi:hypothetical protein